jgi:hypothetical protein
MEHQDPIIHGIIERNKRVEADKAWETSWTRRLFIACITYVTACLFLWLIENPHPTINALVPTGGYLLSTLSLPWLKRWWINRKQA